jgi:acyl-coenzyme A synthetase/AMP-(fatty) acid ligase
MSTFLKDLPNNKVIAWDLLFDDIRNTSVYNPYCKSQDYYTIFKTIILSLLIGEEIILLDSDYSESEILSLTGFSEYSSFDKLINKEKISTIIDKEDLINRLSLPSIDWKVTLFTSGTTGIPKKITHTFKSISRFIKINEKNKNSIWGFAYSPTHMAGVQVFFQAILNGNTIIRLFGLNTIDIHNEIKNARITHISATPTFYRLLLPCSEIYPSVQRITSGGEKFNINTINPLKRIFPNAKITNIYASTEVGALFASENDVFSINEENLSLIRIENNELLIHKSLMGTADVEFDDWYNTGDVIEIVLENPLKFRFLNRKSEMINVGGYKVNPIEVEEAILTYSNIISARVYSKTNSVLGNIVCCEVVSNSQILEADLRNYLKSKLQEFKIPRVIKFVEDIITTRTGKLKRI